ncbi:MULTISPECIES: hypothetical protein, partial [Paraburkholderia]|uniref:hypothetical protein n=1 Tax=Paraburkholderia TaxID=1822464 RepID=UPI00225707E6
KMPHRRRASSKLNFAGPTIEVVTASVGYRVRDSIIPRVAMCRFPIPQKLNEIFETPDKKIRVVGALFIENGNDMLRRTARSCSGESPVHTLWQESKLAANAPL